MAGSKKGWITWVTIAVAAIAGLIYGFRAPPIEVDLATATVGPLVVSVNEDGKTRVRERYIVSAPLAGRLLRVELHSGDPVVANKTVIAVIEASDSSLLDDRARAEAEARVNASIAEQEQARTQVEAAKDTLQVARVELDRVEQLRAKGIVTQEDYDEAQLKYRLGTHQQQSAEFGLKIAEFELEQARSALVRYRARSEGNADLFRYAIHAPITGRVFRVFQESTADIQAGTRLIELGNLAELEVEIDVLSSDAAKIRPGAKVWLKHWGGDQPLEASVRLIEPSAFTKISALGIEEQRVWVIADLVTPSSQRTPLGDGFRVEASIVVAQTPNALKIPSGCLFRTGETWMVFLVRNHRVESRPVEVGLSNGIETEILNGVTPGDQVVLHPSDRISSGVRVVPR